MRDDFEKEKDEFLLGDEIEGDTEDTDEDEDEDIDEIIKPVDEEEV